MKLQIPAVLGILAILAVSGCTGSQSISAKDPSEMVLKIEDLPTGFSVNESRYRTAEDIPEEALGRGWKSGYIVRFDMQEEYTGILNLNSVYPTENITLVLDSSRKENEELGISAISIPKIGDDSFGYKQVDSILMFQVVKYTIEFRKYNVYEVVSVIGIGGKVSADDAVRYAQIVDTRI